MQMTIKQASCSAIDSTAALRIGTYPISVQEVNVILSIAHLLDVALCSY